MAFNRYDVRDSVVSSETVVRGLWNNDVNSLTTFFTSSIQVAATIGSYYLNISDTSATSSVQFTIEYGHISGSGSISLNSSVPNNSVSRIIYGQYRNLIYGNQASSILDGGLTGNPITDFYAVNISRARYKESLKPSSLTLTVSGSSGFKQLTDDSQLTATSNFIDSNIYYNLRSGSAGVLYTADTTNYGYVFPSLGVILLNPTQLTGYVTTPTRTNATGSDPHNCNNLFNALVGGGNFSLMSQETISSRYFFTRVYNSDSNYTTNPSVTDSNGNLIYATLVDNPQTYVTTVGLYNDNNELLAVAKLSKPLSKDFTKELLLRIKMDFVLVVGMFGLLASFL